MVDAWFLIAAALMAFGLLSSVTPGGAGSVFLFVGPLLYDWAHAFRVLGADFLVELFLLTTAARAIRAFGGPVRVRKLAASTEGRLAALVGGIVGTLSLGPLGMVLGTICGAAVGELVHGEMPLRLGAVGWTGYAWAWVTLILELTIALLMVQRFFSAAGSR